MLTTPVHFNNWDSMIDALKHTYTTSLKDLCRMLKSSRNWVNRYIRPFVRHIYLNNNIRGNSPSGINWIQMASYDLGREMTESIWFHTEELNEYILNNITSITKQTKSVPVTFFMNTETLAEYEKSLRDYDYRISITKSLKVRGKLIKERENCYTKYVIWDTPTKELFSNLMSITQRTLAPPYPVELPDIPISEWAAPHDKKDYGDVDETIYRNFFKYGYIKIELKFSDENGCIGRKVYYVSDPEPITDNCLSVIFSEIDWQHYLNTKKDELL